MTTVIDIQKISKKYLLYHQASHGNSTLVETIANKAKAWAKPFQKKPPKPTFEEFWALQDCSFKINEGDRIGIVGKNGAGKSTLLKVLSRITEPTHGRIHIRGRISSLLEVGTGFHPELSGRENIFLNGAILGMTSREIKAKFDDIVEFAEVEKFLDTPVKRYSSGMYTRLGFSIAAHLDPDILIIDEVLAVGDAPFQEKCLKKLNELGSVGRTVLFVSHDIGNIINLCNKGVHLVKGRVEAEGPIDKVVESYLRNIKTDTLYWQGDIGDEHIRFHAFGFPGNQKEYFLQHEEPVLELNYEVFKTHPNLHFGLAIYNSRNHMIARSDTADNVEGLKKFTTVGKHRLLFPLPVHLFNKGEYSIKLESVIHNVKPIILDNPTLKFPVYSENQNTRFSHLADKSGVVLKYNWHESHHG